MAIRTERQAGKYANQVRAEFAANRIGIFTAVKCLQRVEALLSETQQRKLADLAYAATHNKHMYDANGFRK